MLGDDDGQIFAPPFAPKDSGFHVSSCVCVFSAGAGTCHMTENEIFGSGIIWEEFIANINNLRMVDRDEVLLLLVR